jgi:mRNA interferase RelE/StbE
MASFEIRWRSSTKKDLRHIPQQEVSRIVSAAARLGDNPLPRGSEKLTGADRTYRLRVGDYRIVYELIRGSNAVEIQRVRHRKDVYRA